MLTEHHNLRSPGVERVWRQTTVRVFVCVLVRVIVRVLVCAPRIVFYYGFHWISVEGIVRASAAVRAMPCVLTAWMRPAESAPPALRPPPPPVHAARWNKPRGRREALRWIADSHIPAAYFAAARPSRPIRRPTWCWIPLHGSWTYLIPTWWVYGWPPTNESC